MDGWEKLAAKLHQGLRLFCAMLFSVLVLQGVAPEEATAATRNYKQYFNAGTLITYVTPNLTTNMACPSSGDLGPVPGDRITLLGDIDGACAPAANRDWLFNANGKMLEMYNGPASAVTTTITGTSVVLRFRGEQTAGTANITLFYTDSSGVRVNFAGAPTAQAFTTTRTTYTISLVGQSATVPAGSRLGLEITSAIAVRIGVGPSSAALGDLIVDDPSFPSPPQINKDFSPAGVAIGTPSTLTLTITNPAGNNQALTGLAVTDTFPTGMSVAPTPNFSNTCGGSVSPGQNQGDTSLSFSGGGPLTIGSSCTIKVDVVATVRGSNNNTTGPISSANGGSGGTATATLNVTNPSQPVLTKLSSPDPVGVSQSATLTFRISNSNETSLDTDDYGFTDTLPAGVVVANPANPAATCTSARGLPYSITANPGSNTITVAGIDMGPLANCTVSVNITSSAQGIYVNDNSRITLLQGGLTSNANDTLNVIAPTLTKAFAPSAISINQQSTLTLTLTNGSGNPYQSGMSFRDTLPAGLTVAVAPISPQCNGTITAPAGGNTIQLSGGVLYAGQSSCTVNVAVTSTTAGSYVNDTSNLSALSAGMTNNANATLTVTTPTMATIAKDFTPDTIDVYQPSTMTFTLGNANGITLSNANFTDTLSGFYVRSAAIGGTCLGVSNAPALAAGATALDLTVPSLPPGGCTITIPVTGSVPGGPFNNTSSGVTTSETGATAGAVSNTATLTINRLPLQLTKVSSSGATVNPGGTIDYSIGYSNINVSTPFQNVVITDPLPPFTTFLSASCGPLPATLTSCGISAPAVGAGGTVIWTMGGTLDAGSSGNVYLSVQVQ